MELVLATKNINKIRRLKRIINKIFPDIILTDISDLNIESPQENGLTQEENLNIKLNYYHRLLNKNTISEDDIIELKTKEKYISIVKINNFFNTKNDLFENWIDYLGKNNINAER
ncbi:MAG: non-canonical purine NTP pyrophosphatase, partial [Candidatus Shapirobacteria bacterium]